MQESWNRVHKGWP